MHQFLTTFATGQSVIDGTDVITFAHSAIRDYIKEYDGNVSVALLNEDREVLTKIGLVWLLASTIRTVWASCV